MICYLWSAGGEIVYNAISNAKNDELVENCNDNGLKRVCGTKG
jgi:hypothetical protein